MDWLIKLGYWGLFVGTFLAGTVIPMSSDVLLNGAFMLGNNPWVCLIVGTIGNCLGLMTTYSLGWLGKWEWLERWFNVRREKLEKQKKLVNKYGVWIAFFPWIPVIGVVGLVALGFYKIRPKTSIFLLFMGTFSRYLLWTILFVNYGEKFIERFF